MSTSTNPPEATAPPSTAEPGALRGACYLNAVLETVPECIKVLDRDGTVLDMNAAGLAMLDAPSRETVIGKDMEPFVVPRDREAFRGLREVAFDGACGRAEIEIVTFSGRRRWVEMRTTPLRDNEGTIVGALGVTYDVTHRRDAAEAEARARRAADLERARLEAVLDALPAGVLITDADGKILRMSRHARELLGGDLPPDAIAMTPRYPARLRGTTAPLPASDVTIARALRGETVPPRELELRRMDGSWVPVLAAAAPVRDAEGRLLGAVSVATDLSERLRLETQLRHAQKMEAVGQLAGGVAHDFNNLLTVIHGNLEFARHDLAPDHPVQADLMEVTRAAERAQALVRQLLAFSRKQVLQTQALDVNDVVRGADALLRRVLGDEIAFETRLGAQPAVVHADRGQLEQVLLNLAVNARDAMLSAVHGHPGTGGTLSIATDVVDHDGAGPSALPPGPYVRLTVTDTGHGMDATTRARIFEPFFTTKGLGVGTGLGLAMVYGIVAQAGGAVSVESAPGAGTTFTILFPYVDEVVTAPEPPVVSTPTRGHGTVLLVEDEPAVRVTTRRVLERHGFGVLEARHGVEALQVWRRHMPEIVCCVTDLRMPEMGGRELVSRLRAERPALPVVYVSGYSDQAAGALAGPYDALIEKPFTRDALLAALHAAIGHDGGRG
jgi:PAS domain S-box-containing protein